MRTIKFPDMFNSNSTNVWKASEYHEATLQSLKLLLGTERGEVFGDPYFGLLFRHYMFAQNNYILKDHIIDMIYTQVAMFMPQLRVNRTDIDIVQNKNKGQLICTFKAINQIDYKLDTYNLVIFDENENK